MMRISDGGDGGLCPVGLKSPYETFVEGDGRRWFKQMAAVDWIEP